MAARARERPWWLEGEVVCAGCATLHAALLEVRCADCDAQGCGHCTVHVRERRVRVCAGCAPGEKEAPRRRRGGRR